jgi:hypothetical protein
MTPIGKVARPTNKKGQGRPTNIPRDVSRISWSSRLIGGIGYGLNSVMTSCALGLAEYGAAHGGLTLRHFCNPQVSDSDEAHSRPLKSRRDLQESLSVADPESHR